MKVTIEIDIDLEESGINELYFWENQEEIVENLLLNGAEEEALAVRLLSYEYDRKDIERCWSDTARSKRK